jgi:tetratricopeptide (TPR) repeat protein
MVSVFLSHSSKDKPFVRDLAAALETGGDIQVWLDEREIGYGENIVVKIGEGLDADVVLLILSPDSVDSKWVKEEWTDAYWDQVENQRTKLAGVLYRDCKIPRLLRNKKYFDLTTNQPEGFRQIKSWLLDLRPPVAPPAHLPQRSARFIGREEEIDTLSQQLKEEGSLAYISGLGGRGKTTLALEYAHRHKAKFESVHWLPCQQRSLVQIAGELAFQLGLKLDGELDTIVHEVNGHSARKRCLLIFDNVDDETPARLLPGGRTSVLITTRVTNLRFLRGYRPVSLPLFTEEQCFELFRDVIGAEEVDRHAAAAQTIFHKLDHLPIGISIAAALLREDPLLTIDQMARNPPADVYALFAEAIAALTASARMLLAAMAACAPEGFRLTLAAEVSSLDPAASSTAARELFSRSLVELLDKGTQRYRLHAMVRDAAGAAPETTPETINDLRQKHALAILNQFEQWETEWRRCEADMADWQSAFAWSLQQPDDEAWSIAKGLGYRGFRLTFRLGRLSEAHEICERMVSDAGQRDDKQRVSQWLCNQAVILKNWGRLDEAMEFLRKQEAICLELGDGNALQASYGNQALILKAWGRLDEALALHKKEEATCLELSDRGGLSMSYGNQANILQDWGRLDEAMTLHHKEEAICLELGDRDGIQKSYCNQANVLRDWGRLDEAMELLQKQETICLDLNNKEGLAHCYREWGRLARKQGDRRTEREKLEQAFALFTELKMPREVKGVQDHLDELHGDSA